MKKLMMVLGACALAMTGCSGANAARAEQFVVGMECNYAPFNWTQSNETTYTMPIDGNQYCDGYDVQIAKQIAEDLGKELVIKKTAWDGLILSLKAGEIDAIIAGMSATDERRQEVDFTNPYFTGEFGVLVQRNGKYAQATSLADFAGARATAQLGTFHVSLLEQISGADILSPMRDFPTMTVALKAGEIDLFVTEISTGKTIEATNPDLMYVSFAEGKGFEASDDELAVSIGVAKGNAALVKEINQSLAKVTRDKQNEIMDAAIARQVA